MKSMILMVAASTCAILGCMLQSPIPFVFTILFSLAAVGLAAHKGFQK